MVYVKINSYTRVLSDGKKTKEELELLISKNSLSKSTNYLKDKKNRNLEEQNKLYIDFVEEVFEDCKIICQRKFHELIASKFNGNTTYYRRRMLSLGLISEKNLVITRIL